MRRLAVHWSFSEKVSTEVCLTLPPWTWVMSQVAAFRVMRHYQIACGNSSRHRSSRVMNNKTYMVHKFSGHGIDPAYRLLQPKGWGFVDQWSSESGTCCSGEWQQWTRRDEFGYGVMFEFGWKLGSVHVRMAIQLLQYKWTISRWVLSLGGLREDVPSGRLFKLSFLSKSILPSMLGESRLTESVHSGRCMRLRVVLHFCAPVRNPIVSVFSGPSLIKPTEQNGNGQQHFLKSTLPP